MSNDDVYLEAFEDLLEEEGVDVVYQPKDGSTASTIQVLAEFSGPFQEAFDRGHRNATGSMKVKKTDMTNPVYGDLYTFSDGVAWRMLPDTGIVRETGVYYEIDIMRVHS